MKRLSLRAGCLAILAVAAVFCRESVLAEETQPDLTKLPPASAKQVDFVRDVQPLLKARCWSCHGPEEEEGGLRLHRKTIALRGGNRGPAIVAKKSAESRLVHYVAGLVEDLRMPPEGEGTPLTPVEIGIIRAWIDQGAVWPEDADLAAGDTSGSDHWSFQAPVRHAVPDVKQRDWVRNAIDAFILAKLETQEIAPSPEASRETLLRRLHLDLVGLPPEADAVRAFLADNRPGAYERAVEGLLASPHFGERWGRHWLDVARYADSDGYEKDRPRPHAWRYRQWVIEALNADLPYDQFTIMQLAGDMLVDAGLDGKVAAGFHRNTLHNTEGGTDREEDRVKKTVDRTNTLGTVWMGLTIGCAQCHSHKYDPISQREFYSLYALLNNINEADIDAPLEREREAFERATERWTLAHAALHGKVADYEKSGLASAQLAWEVAASKQPTAWRTLDVVAAKSTGGAKLARQDDGSLLASGTNAKSDVYTIEALTDLAGITAIRVEALPDKSLPASGPGRSKGGNFVLSTLRVTAAPAMGAGDAVEVKLRGARADFSQDRWPVAAAINDKPEDGWAVSPQFGKRHVAVFETAEDAGFADGTKLTITLDHTYQADPHNLGRFRISLSTSPRPVALDGLPTNIAAALKAVPAKRTKAQQDALAAYFKTIDPGLRRLQQVVADHAKSQPKPPGTKAQSVAEVSPRPANIHIRGDFLRKGAAVEPDTPEVLPQLVARGERPDRVDLAHWLVSGEHPLTARVTVNRVWQRIFGRGIVPTSDDFGSQGDPPSHPELLDWLALEFQHQGWGVKSLIRTIVTSATYRQSAATRPELLDRDPGNLLLARQNRRRVEAEVIRDLALSASGLLDPRVGGPSVRPPQPADHAKLTYANSARWTTSAGGDAYRRGLYTFFQRTSPYPMLMTFDTPDSNACCVARSRSNTPLQALTLWNDPVFFECSQALGRRIIRDVPGDATSTVRDRAVRAFLTCLSRNPDDEELAAVVELYEAQRAFNAQDPEAAAAINGKAAAPPQTDPADLAAWVIVGRALLNLDEFITRE